MALSVSKTAGDLNEVKASPPPVRMAWSTAEPVSIRRLIEELENRGCHQRDIGDALYEPDPNLLEKLR
jgi:hypothetical protein